MNLATPSRVIFFSVKTNALKLSHLIATAQSSFASKEPLMIFVEDTTSETFVDQLLWERPETSFLPHSIAPLKELIVISREKKNLNQAKSAFNLCSTPLLLQPAFEKIYDFEDLTHPLKTRLFNLRFDAYKNAHFLIESIV